MFYLKCIKCGCSDIANPKYCKGEGPCIHKSEKEESEKEPGHHCPYCGLITYIINDHYAHMELMCDKAPKQEEE